MTRNKRKYEGPKSGWWMHGNWWGPNWSAGSYGDSRDYEKMSKYPKPIDYNDESAMFHDQQYAIANRTGDTAFSSKRKRDADFKFAIRGIKSGTVLGTVGAIAVGAQGVARTVVGAVQRKQVPPKLKQNKLILPALSNNSITKENQIEVTSTMAKSSMPSTFTGKARFPNKRDKVAKSKTALKGSRGVSEFNFTSAGDNVAYTGFQSCPRSPVSNSTSSSPTYHVAAALLRMILKKHLQVEVQDHNQTILELSPTYAGGGSYPTQTSMTQGPLDCYVIQFFYKQTQEVSTIPPAIDIGFSMVLNYMSDSSVPNANPQTGVPMRFKDYARFIAVNVLSSARFGARAQMRSGTGTVLSTDYTRRSLYGYRIVKFMDWQVSHAGGTRDVFAYSQIYRLENWKIAVNCKHTIYFQNQTQSDGLTNDVDRVDTNPVKGRIYYFKNATPEIRMQPLYNAPGNTMPNWNQLTFDSNGDGIIIPPSTVYIDSGSGLNATQHYNFEQLPESDQFLGSPKYSNVTLEPGEMKSLTFGFKFYGYIQKYIEGLRLSNGQYQPDNDTVNYELDSASYWTMNHDESHSAMGTALMFAFEKRLSTGSGQVKIVYQRNTSTSAMWVKATKSTAMRLAAAEVAAATDS